MFQANLFKSKVTNFQGLLVIEQDSNIKEKLLKDIITAKHRSNIHPTRSENMIAQADFQSVILKQKMRSYKNPRETRQKQQMIQ